MTTRQSGWALLGVVVFASFLLAAAPAALDMDAAAVAVSSGAWSPQSVTFAELPVRFGYRLSPQAQAALPARTT